MDSLVFFPPNRLGLTQPAPLEPVSPGGTLGNLEMSIADILLSTTQRVLGQTAYIPLEPLGAPPMAAGVVADGVGKPGGEAAFVPLAGGRGSQTRMQGEALAEGGTPRPPRDWRKPYGVGPL